MLKVNSWKKLYRKLHNRSYSCLYNAIMGNKERYEYFSCNTLLTANQRVINSFVYTILNLMRCSCCFVSCPLSSLRSFYQDFSTFYSWKYQTDWRILKSICHTSNVRKGSHSTHNDRDIRTRTRTRSDRNVSNTRPQDRLRPQVQPRVKTQPRVRSQAQPQLLSCNKNLYIF